MSRATRLLASVATSAVALITIASSSVSGVVPASADVVVPAEAGVYTAAAAPTKMVGAAAYTWGRFPTSGSVRAWTEVKVGGVWSRSQVVSTDATGYYVIPLTYGANTAGTYTFRVRGELPGGVVSTQEFTVRRLAKPTVTSAGAKLVGLTTYVWGRVDGAGGGRVWTEVFAGGRWVRSQVGQTSSSGSYTLPLTYGASTRGTYSFRVRAEYPDGDGGDVASFHVAAVGFADGESCGVEVCG
ncbi:hypothetical protein ACQBAU_18115 [Propionibacteriaceae bacterium Y2011]